MLKITVPACAEQYDELREVFLPPTREQTLSLEHSLVSISKWEAKWLRPYISRGPETMEEMTDYVRCMTLTQNVDPNVYTAIPPRLFAEITAYIKAPMTATRLAQTGQPKSREVVTSELIYYWMIYYNIPMECQKWHLNKLMTLIGLCSRKNAPQKKMSQREVMAQNRALNQARRKRLNTRG